MLGSNALDALTPIAKLIERLSKAPNFAALSIEQQRAATEALAGAAPDIAPATCTTQRLGDVDGAWIESPASKAPHAILFIHGGAFVAGSVRSHLPLTAPLAEYAEARVYAVDYRLAPEAPYPAGLEDCQVALAALAAQADIDSVAVVADSAGAALGLSSLIAARDAGERNAHVAVFISPWTDLSCSAKTFDSLQDDDPLLSRDFLTKMAGYYLGSHSATDPAVSPQFGDLQGLPPMLLQTGTRDVLHGDALSLHEHAVAAGCECTLDVWPEMIHVWHGFRGLLPEADAALRQVGQFLKANWPTP